MVPLAEVLKLGYAAVIATPSGKKPSIDHSSDDARFFKDEVEFKKLKALHDSLPGLRAPSALSAMDEGSLADFDAVFFPGGHAPMEDLARSPIVGRILGHFHSRGKPAALICHGPAALLAGNGADGSWLYAGYEMTAFSAVEEKQAEKQALGGEVEFYLDDALTARGGKVSTAAPWTPRVVRDRELITGQNPQSDRELVRELLVALAETRLGNAVSRVAYHTGLRGLESGAYYEVTPFPKDWRQGFTNVYVGARRAEVSREAFMKALVPHLDHARTVFGPSGMRGYLVLSDGNYEIAFMNWPSKEAAAAAGSAPGREAVLAESGAILESLSLAPIPNAAALRHPALP